MNKLSPTTQTILWFLLAVGCLLLSCLPQFERVATALTHLTAVICGKIFLSKPDDIPADLALKISAQSGVVTDLAQKAMESAQSTTDLVRNVMTLFPPSVDHDSKNVA